MTRLSVEAKYFLPIWLFLVILPLRILAQEEKHPRKVDLHGGPLPAGAIARMESAHLLDVPNGQINTIAISPIGNLAASPTYYDGIVLWDLPLAPALGSSVRHTLN